MYCVFFFKQKTAYEMRISDWSSDVCSSDLLRVTTFCDRHALLLTDLAGIRALGRTQAAERALAARVARTRAQMARFAFVKTRVMWNGMIAREQIRDARHGERVGWERNRAAPVGNPFHYAQLRPNHEHTRLV